MRTNIELIPISLSLGDGLAEAVKQECIIQAARDPDPRKLASSFVSEEKLMLIFELYDQN